MSLDISTKTKRITRLINTSFKEASTQDLELILAIENRAYTFPWTKQKLTDSFNNSNISIQLILVNEKITGYLITLHSIDFIDILNICIDPKFQQQGLGRRLLDDLLKRIQKTEVKSVFLEVRFSNVSAIDFYKNYGFELLDTRKKYYSNLEDAKILRLQII